MIFQKKVASNDIPENRWFIQNSSFRSFSSWPPGESSFQWHSGVSENRVYSIALKWPSSTGSMYIITINYCTVFVFFPNMIFWLI